MLDTKTIDSKRATKTYTTSDAMMKSLDELGVSYIFANTGSDYPAIIESWAKANLENSPMPSIIICPHEFVAISAAHGYAAATGKAQAVFVHVDVGTQNLGGGIHNASRARAPMLIFAGASPVTMEGERTGSRNEYIHFLQDVYDQRGIVRQYMKWDYEIRAGENIKQIVARALQISQSGSKGPVYLMAAREVLEESVANNPLNVKNWSPIVPSIMPTEEVATLVDALAQAKNPLIITSYVGRNQDAVAELVRLSERLSIPVIESGPYYMNFPADHPMHLGYQRNDEHLSNADLVLVIDCDVPWITSHGKPSNDCRVFYIDVDPLKEHIPLWYIPSEKFYKVDSYLALKQLNTYLDTYENVDQTVIQERYNSVFEIHREQRKTWKDTENLYLGNDVITPEWLTACLREVIDDETIIVNESPSNASVVWKHIQRTKPGTLFGSGASSLGWHGGAAIGIKMANPDKTVVCTAGDGSYIFSVPTAVHWVSKKYNAPFLTVIYNNCGWKSPKNSTLWVHPNGLANQNDTFWISFDPTAELDKVAEAAGGAFAKTVQHPDDLKEALKAGLAAVRGGRSAVINVLLPAASQQDVLES